ncbi:hypothetical protein L6164_015827 [Bauhinia variegata]|uniref:Uncharacterized protein n=1 Tax=Bauhinia variegata TaxID=167791 RepID=A0ACB9NLS0_BAUVA|nr:hypothetical protein L6164_015827 [Bauhinia variegata]
MAPRKRKTESGQVEAVQPSTTSLRVTRLSLKKAKGNSPSGSVVELPKPALPEKKTKKGKGAGDAKRKETEKGEDTALADTKNVEEKQVAADAPTKKTIVIEHCKQCNQFKKRAIMVKERLEKTVSGITVVANPDKPRRGCFEIREEGGQIFISLLDMKRPFQPMKDLDMDKVITDIIEKIN